MTCRATGRRPRRQRILVAAGPSGHSDTFSYVPLPPVTGGVVEMPERRKGCALTALFILCSFVGGGLYIFWHIARAVWS